MGSAQSFGGGSDMKVKRKEAEEDARDKRIKGQVRKRKGRSREQKDLGEEWKEGKRKAETEGGREQRKRNKEASRVKLQRGGSFTTETERKQRVG